jgi:hypothetical protein
MLRRGCVTLAVRVESPRIEIAGLTSLTQSPDRVDASSAPSACRGHFQGLGSSSDLVFVALRRSETVRSPLWRYPMKARSARLHQGLPALIGQPVTLGSLARIP